MKKLKLFLTIFILLCSFKNGYSQDIYEIDDAILVRLNQENESKLSVAAFRNPTFRRGNSSIQFGFSPRKNIGIVTSVYHSINFRNDFQFQSEKDYRKNYSGLLGIGYYKKFQKGRKNLRWKKKFKDPTKYTLFDAYLGYRIGQLKFDYYLGGQANIIYHRPFIQLGYHVIKKKWGFNFALKFGGFNLRKINLEGKISQTDIKFMEATSENANNNFTTASFRIFYFFKKINIFANFNGTDQSVNKRNFYSPDYSFNFGIVFTFNKK